VTLIDSHFHLLALAEKGVSADEALEGACRAGVLLGIDIGIDLSAIDLRTTQAKGNEGIYLAHGLAPVCSQSPDWRRDLQQLERVLAVEKTVALGEIGLDWHWGYGGREEQIELFERELRIADRLDLPVVIHNREADAEVLASLRATTPRAGGVMHCFSSDYTLAAACIDLGFLISFAGNLSYRSATDLREVAARLPGSAILLETDSPYLAPQPVRGKTNRPEYVRHLYELMAELRGVSVSELADDVLANFHRLFRRAGEQA
jgi:TatD DNase family protein